MKFDINRVYTSVNAEKLKIGSKVFVADTIDTLRSAVEVNDNDYISKLDCIESGMNVYRFSAGGTEYALAYLVSEPEEKKLKWTDLKIGDVIRRKGEIRMITGISTVRDSLEMHIFNGTNWLTDDELAEWEKVEE